MRFLWTKILVAVFVGVAIGPSNAAPQPNIIYIISDDQGWKDVGYHGSDIKTTNLRKIGTRRLFN